MNYKKAKDGSWIKIKAGTPVIVTSAGKLRTSGTVKIEGDRWKISISEPDANGYAKYEAEYDDPYAKDSKN